MEQYAVVFALACAAAAVAYGLFSAQWILGLPQGNDRMRQIAAAIQEGAGAYMKRQYTIIAAVGVVMFVALFATLGWHNSYGGLILPGLAAPFGVFFMTQYFKAIPKDLDEAARLDGASRPTIFWKILLPLSFPAQATLGVFTFLGSWNDYWWPLISATTSDKYTLTVGLASSQMNYAQTSGLGFLMAQAVFASIPILIVYIIFQKQIVGAMAGAATR